MFRPGHGVGLAALVMPLIWALQSSGVVPYLRWPVRSMLRAVATVRSGPALVVISWWVRGRMSLGSARLSGGHTELFAESPCGR